jgi:hypothetical protein
MTDYITQIIQTIKNSKFPLHDEKELQAAINEKLNIFPGKIREFELSKSSVVDFFINGIAIEVKIKQSARSIYRQCQKYCKHESVKSLILITNRTMGFPDTIEDKPCYLIILGKAWL